METPLASAARLEAPTDLTKKETSERSTRGSKCQLNRFQ